MPNVNSPGGIQEVPGDDSIYPDIVVLIMHFIAGMDIVISVFKYELGMWAFLAIYDECHGDIDCMTISIQGKASTTLVPQGFGEVWTDERRLSEYIERANFAMSAFFNGLLSIAQVIKLNVDHPEHLEKFEEVLISDIVPERELRKQISRAYRNGEWPPAFSFCWTEQLQEMPRHAIEAWPDARAGLKAWAISRARSMGSAQGHVADVSKPRRTRGRGPLNPRRERLYLEINKLWGSGDYRTYEELARKMSGRDCGEVTPAIIKCGLDWGDCHPDIITPGREARKRNTCQGL